MPGRGRPNSSEIGVIMSFIIAAVAIVSLLCLLNLLLTFGVVRRLREHTAILTGTSTKAGQELGLSRGELPGTFSAFTIDGEPVNGSSGLRMVAFFASWCSVCPERVPVFISYLDEHHIGRDNVLAVSVGPESSLPPYLPEIASMARVCVEHENGEIATAFKLTGFPAFFLLDADGAVAMSGYDPAALPGPVSV
jgi:thiol-disulfide isomerase/thioredoxin